MSNCRSKDSHSTGIRKMDDSGPPRTEGASSAGFRPHEGSPHRVAPSGESRLNDYDHARQALDLIRRFIRSLRSYPARSAVVTEFGGSGLSSQSSHSRNRSDGEDGTDPIRRRRSIPSHRGVKYATPITAAEHQTTSVT